MIVDNDVSLNDNNNIVEQDTRMSSLSDAKHGKTSFQPQFANLSTTNNIFEFGSSSLLVDYNMKPNGLFSNGDRFVPVRPEEHLFQGA